MRGVDDFRCTVSVLRGENLFSYRQNAQLFSVWLGADQLSMRREEPGGVYVRC